MFNITETLNFVLQFLAHALGQEKEIRDISIRKEELSFIAKKKDFFTKNWREINDKTKERDFPGGTVVENLPADAGDTGLSPGLGRSYLPPSN